MEGTEAPELFNSDRMFVKPETNVQSSRLFLRLLICALLDGYPLQSWIELDERVIDCAVLGMALQTSLRLHWTRRTLRQSVLSIEDEEAPFLWEPTLVFDKSSNATQIGLEVPRAIRANVRS